MRKLFGSIIVAVLFSLIFSSTALAATFSDVPTSHTYYNEIKFLLDNGVIDASSKYGVNDKVTREEVAVMVSKGVGLDGKQTSTKFKDVPSSLESSGYINSAVNAGIINGYPDGTFKPKALVTRGHMAAFISRGFKLTQSANINFKDVPEGSTAYEHVKKLAYKKITTGYLDGTFKPNENLTRAHISVFIARAMGYIDSEPATNPVQNPVLGDISLGMTKEQVLLSSDGDFWYETANSLNYSGVNVIGYLADVTYEFEENKLVGINIFHYVFNNQSDLAVLEDYFMVIYKEMSKVYGAVDDLDTDWYDDEDDYGLTAFWLTSTHSALINVRVEMNGNTFGGIRFSILE